MEWLPASVNWKFWIQAKASTAAANIIGLTMVEVFCDWELNVYTLIVWKQLWMLKEFLRVFYTFAKRGGAMPAAGGSKQCIIITLVAFTSFSMEVMLHILPRNYFWSVKNSQKAWDSPLSLNLYSKFFPCSPASCFPWKQLLHVMIKALIGVSKNVS